MALGTGLNDRQPAEVLLSWFHLAKGPSRCSAKRLQMLSAPLKRVIKSLDLLILHGMAIQHTSHVTGAMETEAQAVVKGPAKGPGKGPGKGPPKGKGKSPAAEAQASS